MERLIHFKSAETALGAARDGTIPTSDLVGVVEKMRPGQRCDVRALVERRETILTVRVAAGIENTIQTGQFVRLETDGPSGFVAVAQLTPCYDVRTRRFLKHAERSRAEEEESRLTAAKPIASQSKAAAMAAIDSPMKRMGLVALVIGTLMLAVGLVGIANDMSRWNFVERLLARWWSSVSHTGVRYERSSLVAWGTYLVVIGFLFSFGYELLTRRLVQWIRTGSFSAR
ncbi:hypothetical protein N5C72_07725 [Achromobacter mucicolens]|uniref:Uncharacterized protein n=1 Tax=Achromobacter mucicolens TaxID=1389922 RepID=A0ABD4YUA8_9BURK|nr:hypothetical protein [Achromobacter mucicolens]MDH1177959.1 hypothetical protein [Achromobacter mucicolens]